MPVKKVSATECHALGETFAVIPSRTIRSIRNPDALAIFTYLQDKPKNWILRETDIKQRFSFGRNRFRVATKELRELRLLEMKRLQNDGGMFVGSEYLMKPFPQIESTIDTESCTDGKPSIQETGHTVLPTGGENAHLKKDKCSKEELINTDVDVLLSDLRAAIESAIFDVDTQFAVHDVRRWQLEDLRRWSLRNLGVQKYATEEALDFLKTSSAPQYSKGIANQLLGFWEKQGEQHVNREEKLL